ncbi:hypothetical protein L7F22_000300 [Adiantum nelumboides]|nr:hypothetical protein [Adiantum nelumboides]
MSISLGSGAAEEKFPLLAPNDDAASVFTCDGTVDFCSRPAVRARTGRWAACIFIIGYEIIDRLAYFGIVANLVLYIQDELHQGTVSATKNVNYFKGATLVLPILGAFLADSYLGKFRTIAYLSAFYVVGLVMLTLSASLASLKPDTCASASSCPDATSLQLGFFYTSLYLIAIGTAGVKPCLEAFGADQFDEGHPIERKDKSSFFNWWYSVLLIGIHNHLGTPLYRNKIPGGSSIAVILHVLVAAARKWRVRVPHDHLLLYNVQDAGSPRMERKQLAHTSGFRCLDKAATVWQAREEASVDSDSFTSHSESRDGSVNPWKLCTVTQVEEVKLIFRMIPIWVTTIVHGLVTAQTETFFVQQAATMDRKVGHYLTIPAASMLTFASIAILVMLPIYDWVLIPVARCLTGCERGITLLQRLGVGYFLAIVCIGTAALVERRRLQVAVEYGLEDDPSATIPMSILWLLPQFIMYGVADVFALVGEQEFFYSQMPDSMRTLGMSLYLCGNGLSNYLSNALISVVAVVTSGGGNEGWISDNLNGSHLDYFYWLLAGILALNLAAFLAMSRSHTYKAVGV